MLCQKPDAHAGSQALKQRERGLGATQRGTEDDDAQREAWLGDERQVGGHVVRSLGCPVLPRGDDARLEALRWLLFDNQKVNGFLGPFRFLRKFAKPPGHPAVLEFFKGRIDNALGILDRRLATRAYVLGDDPTIADVSLVGYMYYPADEFGFDIAADHPNIGAWLSRIKALANWVHPYDLMPGHPFKRP